MRHICITKEHRYLGSSIVGKVYCKIQKLTFFKRVSHLSSICLSVIQKGVKSFPAQGSIGM